MHPALLCGIIDCLLVSELTVDPGNVPADTISQSRNCAYGNAAVSIVSQERFAALVGRTSLTS